MALLFEGMFEEYQQKDKWSNVIIQSRLLEALALYDRIRQQQVENRPLAIAVKEHAPAGQSNIFFPIISSLDKENIFIYSSNVLPINTIRSKSIFPLCLALLILGSPLLQEYRYITTNINNTIALLSSFRLFVLNHHPNFLLRHGPPVVFSLLSDFDSISTFLRYWI
jgi:hypothetical protein